MIPERRREAHGMQGELERSLEGQRELVMELGLWRRTDREAGRARSREGLWGSGPCRSSAGNASVFPASVRGRGGGCGHQGLRHQPDDLVRLRQDFFLVSKCVLNANSESIGFWGRPFVGAKRSFLWLERLDGSGGWTLPLRASSTWVPVWWVVGVEGCGVEAGGLAVCGRSACQDSALRGLAKRLWLPC